MTRSFLRNLLALAGILIAIGGCAEATTTPTAWTMIPRAEGPSLSSQGSETSRVIGPEGGVIRVRGHEVSFPAGAVSEPTEISVSIHPDFVGVEFEPHGLQFPADAQPVLTLDLGGAKVGRYGALAVAYTGTGDEILQVLLARSEGGRLQTRLQHFSRYVAIGS